MSFFKKLFSGQQKPRTMLDELNSVLVLAYRRLAKSRGTAPSDKTSDEKIVQIYSNVTTAFREASKSKGEFIPANILNNIVLYFFQAYETVGEEFMNEHLEYEINLYKSSGLREDYKEGLDLFNEEDNKRIKVVMEAVSNNFK